MGPGQLGDPFKTQHRERVSLSVGKKMPLAADVTHSGFNHWKDCKGIWGPRQGGLLDYNQEHLPKVVCLCSAMTRLSYRDAISGGCGGKFVCGGVCLSGHFCQSNHCLLSHPWLQLKPSPVQLKPIPLERAAWVRGGALQVAVNRTLSDVFHAGNSNSISFQYLFSAFRRTIVPLR